MTDQQAEAPEVEGERIHSLADLSEKVDKLFDMLSGQHQEQGSESEPEAAPDVKAETRRAVAEVRRREAAKAARDREKAEQDARLKAVEEKLKEKPPAEYRRVTRFMRWEGDKE